MKQRVKHILEAAVFLVLLAFLLMRSYDVLRYRNTGNGKGMEGFYATEVPIDLITYGTSHAVCTVNTGILWREYGIAAYDLGVAAQSIDGTLFFMEESFRKNKPRVAMVETYSFMNTEAGTDSIYRTSLTVRWSPHYALFVPEEVRLHHLDRTTAEELFFRMPIVHARYSEVDRDFFRNDTPFHRGYWGGDEVTPVAKPVRTDERRALPEDCLFCIDRMINLCEKEGVSLLFFHAPYEATQEEMEYQNAVRDFVVERGIPYFGFNADAERYGIDYDTDMREWSHLNVHGAAKVTRALADYCAEHYALPDRRGDEGYADWELDARYLDDRRDTWALNRETELPDYLRKLAELRDRYTIILTLQGNYGALGEEAYAGELAELGIDREAYARGGVFVLQNGKPGFSSNGVERYHFRQEINAMHDELCVYSDGDGDDAHVFLCGTDYTRDHNGINLQVYDPQCLYQVDDVFVDVYQGTEIRRNRE